MGRPEKLVLLSFAFETQNMRQFTTLYKRSNIEYYSFYSEIFRDVLILHPQIRFPRITNCQSVRRRQFTNKQNA